MARARRAPTSFSRARCCAWACRCHRGISFRPIFRACRPGTRCAFARTAITAPDGIEALFLEQFKGKEKLIGANKHALALGRDWVLANVEARPGMTRACGLQIKRADKVGDRIYIEGNQAAALGAVYGGATVCAWYPLTPSSSLADAFTTYCDDDGVSGYHAHTDGKAKYAIIQGE